MAIPYGACPLCNRKRTGRVSNASSGHSPNETSYQHKNSRSPFSVYPYAERTLKLHWLKETKKGGGKDEVKIQMGREKENWRKSVCES